MPEVLFAYVDDRQVVLHLGRSATAPERPWTVSEDGMSWTLFEDDLVTPGAGVPAPYPCLVNVASSHGFDLLVDLEMAPGLVALGGDADVAREVAMSMAVELVTHAWSDRTEVVMVGFGDELADLDTGSGVRHVPAPRRGCWPTRSRAGPRRARSPQQLGVRGVLQGRQRGAAAHYAPTLASAVRPADRGAGPAAGPAHVGRPHRALRGVRRRLAERPLALRARRARSPRRRRPRRVAARPVASPGKARSRSTTSSPRPCAVAPRARRC